MAKVGKILLAVVTIAAIVALNIYAPGLGSALSSSLGGAISATVASAVIVAVGTVAITLGSALLSNALFGKKIDYGSQKINVRQEAATRWINAGPVLQGGAAVFADHDAQGNLWVVLVHCDSPMIGTPAYYLDSALVTVNPSTRYVTTSDFTDDGKQFWRLWTHTYTETDSIPSAATELQAAFPSQWDTLSHMLVGTTFTVLCGNAIKIKNRYKVYKWRGPIGLGEPNIAVFVNWSNMYDPRDSSQVLGDRSTYKPSTNPVLIWAWWRTHPFGMKKPESEINWSKVAEQANICDETVVGIESTQKRYECAIAAQDNVDRAAIEANIMLSCDSQLVFDDDGHTWLRVGKYEAPTLSLGRNRDIITMASLVAQDGESETQGVVVRYMDHNAAFSVQPSAAWYNPNYYDAGKGNTFLYVDVPTCFNHNQAMRLAKSIGMRSQPIQKIAPTVGLRGLRAMQERIIEINYDNEFAGDYEIISPVSVDESGFFCSLNLIPMDPFRFDLIPGEEKPRPNSSSSTGGGTVDMPVVTSVAYNNGRIEAQFMTPLREDVTYEFQTIAQSAWTDTDADQWADMSVDMETLFAFSGAVDQSIPQYVRWRAVTAGGSATAWYDPPYSVGPVTAPFPPPTNLSATGGAGQVVISWRNPSDSRFDHSRVYFNNVADLGSASEASGARPGALGGTDSFTHMVTAGTRYYWVRSFNATESLISVVGPVTGVAT